ncbi:hypothetical protein CVT25_013016 [Psilocybe cyanescens]|uniref:Uncharacterized protein n=1 Tax=Psilocybe cyanescens TaxID=93625 RepID=A0A409XLW6_PSICY|nr:hypothetical protein CVT25_013016 [Psilocybe cyanescens]
MKFASTAIVSILLFTTQVASSSGSVDGSHETNAGTGFNIRDVSGTNGLQAFVSRYGGGSDTWYDVPSSFDDPATAHWGRFGWEIVAFQVPTTGKTRGWYFQTESGVTNLTFFGFSQDIGLTRYGLWTG